MWCWVVLMQFVLINMGEVLTPLQIDAEIMGTAEVKIHKTQENKVTALYTGQFSQSDLLEPTSHT